MKKVLRMKDARLVSQESSLCENDTIVSSVTYEVPFEGTYNQVSIVRALVKKYGAKVTLIGNTKNTIIVRFTD